MKRILAIDTETTGTDSFHGCRPFLVTACDATANYYWRGSVNGWTRIVTWDLNDLKHLQDFIDSYDVLIFHNASFDIRMLETIGVWKDSWWDKIEDTMIMSHAVCSGDVHGLKDLAIKYYQYWDDDEELLAQAVQEERRLAPEIKARKGHPHFPALKNGKFYKMDYWMCPDECLRYGIYDAERTILLREAFRYAISDWKLKDVVDKRTRLIRVFYDMQTYGINFDKAAAQEWVDKATKEMEKIRLQLKQMANIPYTLNLKKPAHLKSLLYDRLKLPIYKKTKKGPSTDKNTLKLLEREHGDIEAIKLLRKWRLLDKRKDYIQSYILWCDEENCIHAGYNITGTRETRQSSSSPNLQNIEKFLRRYFIPPPGYVRFSLDLVNIELRIWAYETQNKELIEIFERGESVHLIIYETLFPEDVAEAKAMLGKDWASAMKDENGKFAKRYTEVKSGTFSLLYGASEKKSNNTYGRENALKLINKRFPGVSEYTNRLARQVYKNIDAGFGPCIFTIGGYRLDIDIEKMYAVANYRIQGTAGEMIGDMMLALYDHPWNKKRWNMVSQVHDSLDLDIPRRYATQETYDEIVRSLTEVGQRYIPTVAMDYKVK